MSAAVGVSLDGLLASLQAAQPRAVLVTSAALAERRITAACDDRSFFPDFFAMFGGDDPVPGPHAIPSDIRADICAKVHPEFGWFRLSKGDGLPVDAHEFSFALQGDSSTFTLLPASEAGWKCLAFRGTDSPALAFRGRDGLFALSPSWRGILLWYLFWRLLRMRADAIFFHASALGIQGEGTIFVGPKGAGKSTTVLALAARGHNFLSDEIAGYLPGSGELIPFRRPVGIKSGPRAEAVSRGLTPEVVAKLDREGFVRVDIKTLFAAHPPKVVPLRRVVFLSGFSARPSLERLTPGREEIAALQPLLSSFLNESHSRRVFELARLLSTAKAYRLRPGDPDTTARHVEEAFARE